MKVIVVAARLVAALAGIVACTESHAPALPATIAIQAGDAQSVLARTPLPVAPSVALRDVSGRPTPDVPVTFTVTAGDGAVTGSVTVTDGNGIAHLGRWVVNLGRNQLTATALGLSVTFTAFGTVGPPATLEAIPSGGDSALAGTDLDSLPRVQVKDVNGYPVGSGIAVAFSVASGGGSVSGASVLTDAGGRARVGGWRLGPTPGAQHLTAVVVGATSATLEAIATPRAQDGAFRSIAAGVRHTCALSPVGTPSCWGDNSDGALGDGTQISHSAPTLVAGGYRFQKIVVGFNHSCGLTSDGIAYCWGTNTFGGLGDGSTALSSTPVAVAGGLRFSDIAAGDDHTCGIAIDGTAYCWGRHSEGQLGIGAAPDSTVRPTAVAINHKFRNVSAWQWLTCALDGDGLPYCWGRRSETGFHAYLSLVPLAIAGASALQSLAVGNSYGCGLTSTQRLLCWQWGDASVEVPSGVPLRQIGAGSRSCGAALDDGTILCWPTVFNFANPPDAQAKGLSVVAVTVGGIHQCAVSASDAAYCWGGSNAYGQLGTGSLASSRFPVAVRPP